MCGNDKTMNGNCFHQEREGCKHGNAFVCPLCEKPHPEPSWEISFDKEFDNPMAQWTSVAIKSFIHSLLATQEEKIRKEFAEIVWETILEKEGTGWADTTKGKELRKIINEGSK